MCSPASRGPADVRETAFTTQTASGHRTDPQRFTSIQITTQHPRPDDEGQHSTRNARRLTYGRPRRADATEGRPWALLSICGWHYDLRRCYLIAFHGLRQATVMLDARKIGRGHGLEIGRAH